jgi:serine/threonine protein kinase
MTDSFLETFLTSFDDGQYHEAFLKKYEMMECLSNQEFSETFLVKDRFSGEHFIAKCYLKCRLDSHQTECEFLKKLAHPNLPTFIDEYENEETIILVRTFVPGIPLDEFVAYYQPNKELFLSIAKQICDILIYLHRQTPSIIHRDIKPQNIIIDRQGKVTLIDFGISRTYNNAAQSDTICLGTRHFAAPEQYGFSQTDCRTDIFSLGILLAWLLTGESELEKAKPKLPHNRIGKIIRKCVAFDPKDRYQTAVQLKDAFSGHDIQRKVFFAFIGCTLLLLGVFILQSLSILQFPLFGRFNFQEPLIEEAVRLTLGKTPDEVITEDDLLGIETLRVYGNQIAMDENDIKHYTNLFVNNENSIQRGSIHQLNDLLYLPNLRHLTLIYQDISDITPFSQLPYLEYVDLRHNPLKDISPLAGATELTTLNLFGTNVSDLSSLEDCARLSTLDIGSTLVPSFSALEGLESLVMLNIRRTPLQSLKGISALPLLEDLHISETNIVDFSLLLDLPHLDSVHVGENDRGAMEELGPDIGFSIIYDY